MDVTTAGDAARGCGALRSRLPRDFVSCFFFVLIGLQKKDTKAVRDLQSSFRCLFLIHMHNDHTVLTP